MTKTILAEAVTRRSAVQKMTVCLGRLSKAHAWAGLSNWLKMKNPACARVTREAEGDWTR